MIIAIVVLIVFEVVISVVLNQYYPKNVGLWVIPIMILTTIAWGTYLIF